jgi:uncharacterized protein (TIGR03083 family)
MDGTVDLGAMYRASRQRIGALVSDGTADQPVPATPEWTVHDVVAHLRGIVEDALSGNLDGVTTDPWTAAQVERGRHKSVSRLIDEWDGEAPLFESFLSSPSGGGAWRAVVDINSHEADLRHALGLPLEVDADFLTWIAGVLKADFASALADAALPPVEVEAPDTEWFRGRFGRRTVAEVAAYRWSQPAEPYLDHWFVFGRAAQSLGESV